MAIPSSRSSRASVTIACAARRSGSRSVICDPTCMCSPTISRPSRRAARRQMSRDGVQGDAELVRLGPGRDVRMAAGVDVGVDPQRDARARLPLARQDVDALQLAFRLGVDRLDAEVDRLRQLRRGLADAGEDDLLGDEAGPQGDVDLAARVRVRAAAEPPQQPRDRQRRVRLERVVQRVRIRPERVVDRAIAADDGGGAVDVERRALGGGKVGERHAVADEGVVVSMESGHGRVNSISVCRGAGSSRRRRLSRVDRTNAPVSDPAKWRMGQQCSGSWRRASPESLVHAGGVFDIMHVPHACLLIPPPRNRRRPTVSSSSASPAIRWRGRRSSARTGARCSTSPTSSSASTTRPRI